LFMNNVVQQNNLSNINDWLYRNRVYKSLYKNTVIWDYFEFHLYWFYMIIKNVNDIKTKDGIDTFSDSAIYEIVWPKWDIIADDIKWYIGAYGIYSKEIEEYDKKLEDELSNL
jgi:hypothetical protein